MICCLVLVPSLLCKSSQLGCLCSGCLQLLGLGGQVDPLLREYGDIGNVTATVLGFLLGFFFVKSSLLYLLLELLVFVLCLLVLKLCSFFLNLCLLCILICLCFCLLESYSRFRCGVEALLVSLKVSVQGFCFFGCIASFCKRDSLLSSCAGSSLVLCCLMFDLCSFYLCAYLCIQGCKNFLNLSTRLSFFNFDIPGLFCLPGCFL